MLYRELLKPRITEVTNVSFSEIFVHLEIPKTTEIMAIAGIYCPPRSEIILMTVLSSLIWPLSGNSHITI